LEDRPVAAPASSPGPRIAAYQGGNLSRVPSVPRPGVPSPHRKARTEPRPGGAARPNHSRRPPPGPPPTGRPVPVPEFLPHEGSFPTLHQSRPPPLAPRSDRFPQLFPVHKTRALVLSQRTAWWSPPNGSKPGFSAAHPLFFGSLIPPPASPPPPPFAHRIAGWQPFPLYFLLRCPLPLVFPLPPLLLNTPFLIPFFFLFASEVPSLEHALVLPLPWGGPRSFTSASRRGPPRARLAVGGIFFLALRVRPFLKF